MSALAPIERDEGMDRTYIPLPGGWEVQTKGKGSSFRIADTKSHDRWLIMDASHPDDHGREKAAMLERMAREIRAAHEAQQAEIERLRGLLKRAQVPIGHDDAPLLQPCPHCDQPIEVGIDRRAKKSAFFEEDTGEKADQPIHTCDDSPECAACDAATVDNDPAHSRGAAASSGAPCSASAPDANGDDHG